MEAFLKTIARHYYKTYGQNIKECCFVFPNRRSSLYFNKYLAEVCDKPLFAPDSFTINDLFTLLSPLSQADTLGLIFTLYQNYSEISSTTETFDEFYNWGETLLSDFNDIDKYLVDAQQLFSNLLDLKSIDNSFDYLSPEQIAAIKHFWKDFDEKKFSGSRKSFLESWHYLAPLYTKFRDTLKTQNKGYEGMIYRSVIDDLKLNQLKKPAYKRYVFIGLNALNQCEETLLRHYQNLGIADFHWDFFSDKLLDTQNKAGFFLRNNTKNFPQHPTLAFTPCTQPLFESIAVPSNTGQTKIVQQLLKELNISEEQQLEKTAVVLSDEQLMLPMLHALPENIQAYNITMGFPLKNTSVYAFFNQLLNLQKNVRSHDKQSTFYHKNVLNILHYPLITKHYNADSINLSKHLKEHNILYPEAAIMQQNDLFRAIFQIVEKPEYLPDYLKDIFARCLKLQQHAGDDEEEDKLSNDVKLEKEFIYHLYITISRFNDLLAQQEIKAGFEVLIRLLRKHIDTITVPFHGEPLKGLQIMGILETRTLDFEHIIFLSFNEGVFPKTSPINTFIPYNLRFGFGLPTTDHQDAIFAYHFYRIIQRTKTVSMVYDASNAGMKTGEISRFFPQIKFIYKEKIKERSQNYKVELTAAKPIIIKKDPLVMQKLHEFMNGGRRRLSASTLNDYIDCKLKFYFRKVEELKTDDDVKENVDESIFGTIFHSVAENLYAPYENTVIEKDLLYKMSKNEHHIDHLIINAFQVEFFKTEKEHFVLKGRYLIIATIIKKYIIQLLKKDIEIAPFTYRKGEQKLEFALPLDENRAVNFIGYIDRVDEKNGQTRIIDYKTGRDKKMNFEAIEDLFIDSTTRPSAIFQTFIYALLAQHQLKYTNVLPGVYYIRQMFNVFNPNILFHKKNILSFDDHKEEFEIGLKQLLNDIFDPELEFTQTEDTKKCSYCDFKDICMR